MKIINKNEVTKEDIEKYLKYPLMFQDAWIENCDKKIIDWVISKKDMGKMGLYIYGGAGTGKTHTLYAIARNSKLNKYKTKIANTVELISAMRRDSVNKYEERVFESFYEYDGILFLDDIGAEKNSEFVEETLYQIINYRYENCLPTIFTSNLSLKELSEKNGDRLASRIAGMCTVIELNGEDKRLI